MKFLQTQNSLQKQLENLQLNNDVVVTGQTQTKSDPTGGDVKKVSTTVVARSTMMSTPKTSSAKPNKFVSDMEERARQRAARKAELERLKDQRQKEKLEEARKKEEEERRREEEEKQKKLEEVREKKRMEKLQELEKLRKEEEAKIKIEKADEHNRKRLLRWWGLKYWKQVLNFNEEKRFKADEFVITMKQRRHLKAWANYVAEVETQRKAKSDAHCRGTRLQKTFSAWRGVKEASLMQEVKARQLWAKNLSAKVMFAWIDAAHAEKLKGWEKERQAVKHHERHILAKAFKGIKEIPVLARKERERENRKNLLRRKVADLLPDFAGL